MTSSISKMTSRERVLAAMKREPVDHVPCLIHFNPLSAPQRAGYRWHFPWGPSEREKCEYCLDELGVDAFVRVGIPRENPAPDVTSRVWMEKNVIHKVWSTPSGDLQAAVRYDEKWPCGFDIPFFSDFLIGHSVTHWIETEQDVECIKHILRPPEDEGALAAMRFNSMESKRLADRLQLPSVASVGFGLTGGMHLIGATEICLMALEKPEIVHAWLEYEHQLNLKLLYIAADMGTDIVNRNGFYETADFYSPAMLEDFVGERLRAEVRAIREAGMVSTYTINTGVMPILDYLATLGFDNLFGIDIAFHGMDLAKLRASQGDRCSYWIGPSSTYHIWKDAELTRAAVRQCFEVLGRRGLIIGPGVSVHSIMPWENALAMIAEWKKLR